MSLALLVRLVLALAAMAVPSPHARAQETVAPLLSLLGDLDEDGDPKECLPRSHAAKNKGAPVEWHVFDKTGHAWDQPRFDPPRHIACAGSPGGTVLYAHDANVTEESRERAFAFLARRLKRR